MRLCRQSIAQKLRKTLFAGSLLGVDCEIQECVDCFAVNFSGVLRQDERKVFFFLFVWFRAAPIVLEVLNDGNGFGDGHGLLSVNGSACLAITPTCRTAVNLPLTKPPSNGSDSGNDDILVDVCAGRFIGGIAEDGS